MNEGRLERRFKTEVERRGGKAVKFTSPGWAGAPDRIVLLPGGRVAFVELKAFGERPRPLQVKRADELRALGFAVYCLDSVAAVDQFIAEVFNEQPGSYTDEERKSSEAYFARLFEEAEA